MRGQVLQLLQQLGAQPGLAQQRDALIQRQVGDGLVAGAAGERVAAALQAQQHANGPGRHLRDDGQAACVGGLGQRQQAAPVLGRRVALRQ